MKQTFLDFEQPIGELQTRIDELRYVHEDSAVDISDEIKRQGSDPCRQARQAQERTP